MILALVRPPVAVLALLALSAAGCASSPWRHTVISTEGRIILYREHKEVDGAKQPLGHAHPAEVPARDIEALLSRLVYERQRWFADPQNLPVFTPEEAARFAGPVSKALAALSPDERLRFLVPDNDFSNVIFGATGTTGVIFCSSPQALDIAFDRIHEPIDDGPGGRPEEVYFAGDPLEITDAPAVFPIEGSRRRRGGEPVEDYPRWLVVDRAALAALPASPETSTSGAEVAGAGAAQKPPIVPGAGPDPAAARAAASARAANETAAAPQPPPGERAPAPAAGGGDAGARYEEVRRKIENLKRLHADGVITDAEYREQFEALMKEL
jgi:hypothetical protein